MPITEQVIVKAEAKKKPYRIFDEYGLFLEVRPNGKKVWRMRYSCNHKQTIITFGEYPIINISTARQKCHDAKLMIYNGESPSKHREELVDSAAQKFAKENTFANVAESWYKRKTKVAYAPKTVKTIRWRLDKYIIPKLGDKQIDEITSLDLFKMAQEIEDKGFIETAHRIMPEVRRISQDKKSKTYHNENACGSNWNYR